MTADDAKAIIVDGAGQVLSRPLVRALLSADQLNVARAIRDKAEQDPTFAADIAQRVNGMGETP